MFLRSLGMSFTAQSGKLTHPLAPPCPVPWRLERLGGGNLTTGWFTLKTSNVFPGECTRRFFISDREILHVFNLCALQRPHPMFCFFLLPDFSSVKILRKMWTTLAQFFSAKKEKRGSDLGMGM